MISVCIPVFEHDVTQLVTELHKQLMSSGEPFEILLQDDGSRDTGIKLLNATIGLSNLFYEENRKNLGRSKTRNRLAERAKGEYLLFIDNDMEIHRADYIKQYLNHRNSKRIIYGGVEYKISNNSAKLLRSAYGKAIESNKNKNKNVIAYFSACNFFVNTEVFSTIKFDESLVEYGYEDTLFAKEALAKSVKIYCIDNPVLSELIVTNEQFLLNTSAAVYNLIQLNETGKIEANDGIRLLMAYEELKKYGLVGVFRIVYFLFEGLISFGLLKGIFGTKFLQVYKLGEFVKFR